MEIHRRLANDPTQKNLDYASSPVAKHNQATGWHPAPKSKEDVDTKAEDHAYDALRYMMMTRMSGYTSIHKQLGAIKSQVYQVQDGPLDTDG